jgi:crotonobetainyl-CoA:carnitine CoA-transferase CaiB-like acyl-CoA transferase
MLPLGNLKVLDLSRQLPGPFCSALLADLGADVLMISNPADPLGVGIPFLARNKRSMTLNLKHPEGRHILRQLSSRADVLLEGYRPGVPARLGIDYEMLRAANQRLIYCSISGYGQDGPYRDRVGHDINYIGQAGVLNFVGAAGGPPVIPGVQIADIAGGGLMAAVGILTAVIARAQTGRGQFVDISMLDGTLSCNAYHVLMYLLTDRLPQRGGEQLTGYYPCYAVYRHLGREDFIEPQWDDGPKREEMFAFFRTTFRQKTLAEWVRELADKEICFGPVSTLDETLADPQLRHRDMIVEMQTPGGRTLVIGSPIKLSETPASVRTPPPGFGAHTDSVLAALGFDSTQIVRLHSDSVV